MNTKTSMTSKTLFKDTGKNYWLQQLTPITILWVLLLLAGTIFVAQKYHKIMDAYELGILISAGIACSLLGLSWRAIQGLIIIVAFLSLGGMTLYGTTLDASEQSFLLRFLLSSQSAIMWMSALYVMATVTYLGNILSGSKFTGKVATGLTWWATIMGLTGLMIRWRESYLMGADIGHIPISNLYEVFILFCIITGLIYLYYEHKFKTRSMGAFVLLVISAAVGFLLWYTYAKEAHEIQPLVPALQSYWMKIHVPANFIGYGCFSLTAMLGAAYLFRNFLEQKAPQSIILSRLPSYDLLDDVMYKSVALGFAFFTMATILGALWAAEAWGGYWSWDPKETWALIVWLNYAAWLHMRMTKGWRGVPMAWWSVLGLFVTLFAFIGVNMFLSGLHSYGEL